MDWKKLLGMGVISFVLMYILMYAMVDTFGNVYNSLNQFYMAIMMTAVMMIIEIAVMGSMYSNKVKLVTICLSLIIFTASFLAIRNQTGISDREFLKSMISHHGSALLMCNEAKLVDGEIKSLCQDIKTSQQTQIDWMKDKLKLINN